MCHRIGHFSSSGGVLGSLLEVPRFNRRSLNNRVPFLTPLFPEKRQKRREGKGVQNKAVRKRCKKHGFQGPALSVRKLRIRGPGVGAWAGTVRTGRNQKEPVPGVLEDPGNPRYMAFCLDFSRNGIVGFIPSRFGS